MARSQSWSGLIFALLFLACTINGQGVAELMAQVPSCALSCVLDSLQKGQCELTRLADCLCTDIPLQLQLSSCVQTSCDLNGQVRAVLLEDQLCAAYPKPSRSQEVKAVAIGLSAITFPIVALRCVSRWRITGRLWMDDWAALVAGLFLAAIAALEITSSELGFGRHYWNVKPANGAILLQLFYAVQMFYIVVQVAAKTSILLLFLRVFTRPRFTLICKIFIAFLFTHGIAFLFAIIFQCSPIRGIWDRNLESKCINLNAVGFVGSAFSIVEDFVILILPIPELNTLQFGIKKRISLGFMFGIGSFACVTSIVRLKYLIDFRNSLDSTWDNVDVVIWSLAELSTALICGCLPSLRPLLIRYLPSVFGTTNVKHTPDASYRMQKGPAGKFHGLKEDEEEELAIASAKSPVESGDRELGINKPLPPIYKA